MIAVAAVAAYLIGSVPTGVLLVRALRGIDVRGFGSGNIGTVNVVRVAGPWVGVVVLLADALKGAAGVALARALAPGPWGEAAGGLAAIAGHDWSVFLGGRGGKGIATSLGVLASVSVVAAGIAVAVWALVVALTRYASLASILAALSAPIAIAVLRLPAAYVVLGVVGAALALVRHAENVRRLVTGQELRITDRAGR